jgi:hypothetical protein
MVRQGIKMVVPLVAVAIARRLSQSDGEAALQQSMPTGTDPANLLAGIGSPATAQQAQMGKNVVGALFGDKAEGLESALGGATGIDGKGLLTALAPVVLGSITGMARERNLDSAGLASALEDESKELAAANPEGAEAFTKMLGAAGLGDDSGGGIGGFLKRIFG